MIASTDQPKPVERKTSLPKAKRYTGEVVYIFAFDVAYDVKRQPVPTDPALAIANRFGKLAEVKA